MASIGDFATDKYYILVMDVSIEMSMSTFRVNNVYVKKGQNFVHVVIEIHHFNVSIYAARNFCVKDIGS